MDKKYIKNVIKANRGIFEKYQVRKLALFGSYVRNEQNSKSDIDFMVEFKKSSFYNYMGLLHELEDLFGKYVNKVDLVTKKSLNKYRKPYILKEVEYIERG